MPDRPFARVIVLAGAGMSAELGVPTYWTGSEARYGSQLSTYGYTDFQHAQASLWELDPLMQAAFFAQKTRQLAAVDPLQSGSPYRLLNQLLANREHMVVTSNPDSMFQRAGIQPEAIFEVHGTYRNAQCLTHPKKHGIFPAHISEDLLRCPTCNSLARPNVLFFDDFGLLEEIYKAQRNAFYAFLGQCHPASTLVLEIGAGDTVPTIRHLSQQLNLRYDLPVIRINPAAQENQPAPHPGGEEQRAAAPFTHLPHGASEGLRLLLTYFGE